jgi:hypothetical protein
MIRALRPDDVAALASEQHGCNVTLDVDVRSVVQ